MSLQKQTMTMDQLLEQLITKAKLETEEAHRGYIAALNGLAGIDIIEVRLFTIIYIKVKISRKRRHQLSSIIGHYQPVLG